MAEAAACLEPDDATTRPGEGRRSELVSVDDGDVGLSPNDDSLFSKGEGGGKARPPQKVSDSFWNNGLWFMVSVFFLFLFF